MSAARQTARARRLAARPDLNRAYRLLEDLAELRRKLESLALDLDHQLPDAHLHQHVLAALPKLRLEALRDAIEGASCG